VSRAAALAFALVLAAGLVLGEVFPFSRFDMYARAAGRREGAVPLVLADGREIEIERLRGFSAIDATTLLPAGIPCSMEYRVHEIERWIATHPAPRDGAPGPLHVWIGYRVLSLADGRVHERRVVVAEGRAWPR
jgi:hypothetical protein